MNEERIAAPVSTPVAWRVRVLMEPDKGLYAGWVDEFYGKQSAIPTTNPPGTIITPLYAAPVSVQAEQPDTQGNQAASDAAGPSAASDDALCAKRYRWLREHRTFRAVGDNMNPPLVRVEFFKFYEGRIGMLPHLDDAIDAAIAAQEKP